MAQQAIQHRTKALEKAAVFLIYGSDDYLVTEAARRIVDTLCPAAERAFGLDEVDGEAASQDEAIRGLRQCLVALRTVGFTQGRKVVWFRNASFLKNALVLKAKPVQAWMSELTALVRGGLPEGHRLLVTAPGVDGRSAFFKACRETGEVQEYSVPTRAYQARGAARDRARELFRRAGLRAGNSVLDPFLDRAGNDTRQLASEVEKLSLYLGDNGVVTAESVRSLVSVSRTSEGWDLADAVGNRNVGTALALVRQLLFQKIHWVVLMGGLESRFRDLLILRECMDSGWLRKEGNLGAWNVTPEAEALLAGLGKRDPRSQHPYRVGLLLEQAQQFTVRGILARRRMILHARERMVSGFTEPDILLEFLVLRLAGRTPSATAKKAVSEPTGGAMA